jgi:hypothetical protein
VKYLKKCKVSALDGAEGDVVFEISAFSDSNSIMSVIVAIKIEGIL